MSRTKGQKHAGSFKAGNIAALKHGAEGALRNLQKDEPFGLVAQAVYVEVLDELGVDLGRLTGIDQVRVKRAARFETVARLFDSAALGAASAGELDRWERYQQRSGWIGSKAFAALTALRDLVIDGSSGLIIDAVQAAQEAQNGHNQTD